MINILAGAIIIILNILSIIYNYRKENYLGSIMSSACGGFVLGVLLLSILK